MTASVHILNGPNLNLLGIREPHLYGHTTLAQVEQRCRAVAAGLGLGCEVRQSNHEGVLVDWVQEARAAGAAVIINPAGLSFRSIPLLDALKTIDAPVIEVHLSDPSTREPFRQLSYVGMAAVDEVKGLGPQSYVVALEMAALL